METAIWNLKVELAIAIFFLGMEVFSLIHGKVKARIQSKKILPQEEMKDAMGWLFSHCNCCMSERTMDDNVCDKCGKVTTGALYREAKKVEEKGKKARSRLVRLFLLLLLIIVILAVTGVVPVYDYYLQAESDSVLLKILEIAKVNVICGIIFYILIFICLLMCARQFVYEGLEDKYWNKINKDACDYQKVIKPGNSLTNVVDEKLMDKNVKERNKFIFGDKEFRIVIIKRYIKYFCLQGVGLAATIGIVTLIALYWL